MGGLTRPPGPRTPRLTTAPPVRWIRRLEEASPDDAGGVVAWTVAPGTAASAVALLPPRPEDLAHAVRRRDPARRAATLERRLLLRALAARMLGAEADDVAVAQAPDGPPAVVAPRPLSAALAARDGWALVVVSPRPVGADIERVEPGAHRPLDLLHPDMAALLRCADDAAFAAGWAGVEAYLKREGLGLSWLGEVLIVGSRASSTAGDRPTAALSRLRIGAYVFAVAS